MTHNRLAPLVLVLWAWFVCGCAASTDAPTASAAVPPAEIRRIAFGSCLQQGQPQPIWDAVNAWRPDVFVFLGDNIYGDTEDMDVLARKWTQFREAPGYQRLRRATRVTGVWDDHDYGQNDAGKEYPKKSESKRLMLQALGERAGSPRWSRDGAYDVRTFGPPGRRVQLVLLDTRWFRDPLARAVDEKANRGPYCPTDDPRATLLGEQQWRWLELVLRQPAELRIIASSIQFVPSEHGWEKWSNFPNERRRLIDLIARTNAAGVVFITGDRHHAEISCLTGEGAAYPTFDVTSSSLNKPGGGRNIDEPNRWRLGRVYDRENFGTIEVDWSAAPHPAVTVSVRDVNGKPVTVARAGLAELSSPAPAE